MDIAVCVKTVPDYDMVPAKEWQAVEGGHPDISYVRDCFGCFDETALELALRLKEQDPGAELRAVSVGEATGLLKGLYAVGFSQVTALPPAEARTELDFRPERTAGYLAAYFRQNPAELILCGRQTGPGDSGMVPYLLAQELEAPCVPGVVALNACRSGGEALAQAVCVDGTVRELKRGTVVILDNVPDCFLRLPTLKEKLAARTREVLVEPAECPQGEPDGVTLERLEAPPKREKCRFLEGTVEEQAAGLLAWLRESDG